MIIAIRYSRRLRPLAIGMMLAAGVGVMLNWDNLSSEDRDKGGMATMNTVDYRILLLFETADIFLEHPFFGVGFMNFSEAAVRYRKPRDVPFYGHIDRGVSSEAVSHNILVTILAEQGLLGLIPYLLLLWLIVRRSKKIYRSLPEKGLISRDYVVCVWCAMAAYYSNAMFLELRYFEYVNVLFFFLVGAMMGLDDAMREKGARAQTVTVRAPVSPDPPREVRVS